MGNKFGIFDRHWVGGVWEVKKDLVGNSETLTSDEQFKDAVEEKISFIHYNYFNNLWFKALQEEKKEITRLKKVERTKRKVNGRN